MGYDRMVLNVLTFSIANFEVDRKGLKGTLMASEGSLRNYIEFNRPISVITGKTGCGKTMLGIALYSTPAYIASLVFKRGGFRDAEKFVDLVDILLGNYLPLTSMLTNSTIELCRPSVEIPELEKGWSPDVVRRACIRSIRGDVQLTLHKIDGKLEVLDVRENLGMAYRILLQAAMTMSRPSHFTSTQYMLNISTIGSIYKVIERLKDIMKLEDMRSEIARIILATRIPPIILAEEVKVDNVSIGSVQELLGISPQKGPVYQVMGMEDTVKLYLPYSLGELKLETILYDLELLERLQDKVKEYDINAILYMYIDDIFDGFDLKSSLRASQYFIDVLEEERIDARFIMSTHRIESLTPFLERYIDRGTLEYYVATYDLPEIASWTGVARDFKIALVSYASLPEHLKQVYEDHFIRIQLRAET
jgi:hypothetical protein